MWATWDANVPVQEETPHTDLYRLNRGKGFEKEATGVAPSFFDVNEDSGAGAPPLWSVEVGDVETEVSDNFSFDPGACGPPRAGGPHFWAERRYLWLNGLLKPLLACSIAW